jgi:hypothetical protein
VVFGNSTFVVCDSPTSHCGCHPRITCINNSNPIVLSLLLGARGHPQVGDAKFQGHSGRRVEYSLLARPHRARESIEEAPKVVFTSFFFFQDNPPFNKGAFRIEITFPAEYPFKPPKICFRTKIYHPNIDEKGQVCLPIITAENWKPATKTDQGKIPLYE